MSFICPLIYFILANGFLVVISKKSFGKCIPVTMMLNAFIYFFSQVIFQTFKIGFIINILLAISFIIIVINMKLKKKDFSTLKENFFSKGFYVFLTAYIAIYIFDFNREFTVWDEYSHWGEMVKECLRLDRFYSVKNSVLMVHKDYPPIMQLLETFFCTLSGGYKEQFLKRIVHLFCFSMFIPAIADSKKFSKSKTSLKALIIIGIVFLTFLFYDQHGIINSIYNDYLMAIIAAYLLGHIILSKNPLDNFNLITLSLGCSFLILTKQIGLTLYLMALFLFTIDLILKYKKKIIDLQKSHIIYMILKVLVLLILIPLLIWKGWNIYISNLKVEQQFDLADIKLTQLVDIMHGKSGKKYQIDAAANYINAIKRNNLTTSNSIQLSYIQSFVLVLLLLYLIWLYGKQYFYKEELSLLAVTLAIGLIGYAFVMLVTYVFSFGPYEGPTLASFNRYIPTYILICFSVLIMLFIYANSKRDKTNKSLKTVLIVLAVLLLIQGPESMYQCFPKISKKSESVYKYHSNIINKKTKKDDKVFIIAQNSCGDFQYIIQYYSNPRKINIDNFNWEVKKKKDYQEYFDKKINKNILKYDYLYIASLDKKFIDKYNFVFPDDDIKETNLYKIKNDNGKVKLVKVEE